MQISTTRLCSSWLSVGLSPVVPTGTRPCVPSAICQSTKARKASSSTLPSFIGVTSAVIEPLNINGDSLGQADSACRFARTLASAAESGKARLVKQSFTMAQ